MNKYLINSPVTKQQIAELITGTESNSDSGGHSVFLGQVRSDEINGKRVRAIEYSAYDSMVNAEADKIIGEISARFRDVKSIRMLHSIGIVKAGEFSLLVMVSAGHRREAIDACSMAVEMIKERLPVWKKEIFDDDSAEWKSNS